jgi:hypothetical protein
MAAVTFLGVTIPAYRLGKRSEDERQFLRTYRAPSDIEAHLFCSPQYAAKSDESNDILFLGASTCLGGVQTRQFERLTGLSAYNLGVNAVLGIDGYLVLLRTYLEHHPAPRAVVLCVAPRQVGTDGKFDPALTRLKERFLWCYGKENEFPRPAYAEPTRYYKPTPNLAGLSYSSLKQQFSENRGFFPTGGSKALHSSTRRDQSITYGPAGEGATDVDPYPVSRSFDEGVRALAQLTASRHIWLMVRLSPVLPSANEEHFDRVKAWFDLLEADYPNVVCDRPEVMIYSPEYFSDFFSHLNARGAEKFTASLAPRVTQLLSRGPDQSAATSMPDQTTTTSRADAE